MRELLHVHAGTSHAASHFFNTEQSYFTYGSDAKEKDVVVDHDVSFREGLAADGSSTFCPRLLLFDYKANFGSLSNINALYAEEEEENPFNATWSGPVVEHRQDPIPKSSYHVRLEAGEKEGQDDDDESEEPEHDLTPSVHFWSDYSRVFYHPRSFHRVPDPAEWEREIGWAQGVERFALYDAEHAVMENSFRLFAEECDLLQRISQGVQLSLDASSFGSFTVSLLTQLRDEYPKLPLLTFCSLSPHDPANVDLDDTPGCMGMLNDALTLHELASLSTLTVPLQHPTTWLRGPWSEHLDADFKNPYHSSAILATHIESATLPLRLKPSVPSSTDLATLCAHLNWRGDTPFAALSGALPIPPSPSDLETLSYDFSHPPSFHEKSKSALPFAQRDVFRGLDPHEAGIVRKWVEDETQPRLREPLLSTSYIDAPYPIPSSHPQFFARLGATGRGIFSRTRTRVRSVPTYTSLRTTPRTGALAGSYARLLENMLRRRAGVLDELGAERELMGEVVEGFWGWRGAYGTGEDDEDDGEWGEDERDIE